MKDFLLALWDRALAWLMVNKAYAAVMVAIAIVSLTLGVVPAAILAVVYWLYEQGKLGAVLGQVKSKAEWLAEWTKNKLP